MKRRVVMRGLAAAAVLAVSGLWAASGVAAERFITVASTTSTENSGLFKYLLPLFTQKTGIEVRVVAVGTGQAIGIAERGDCNVLFVHHKASEEKFVASGNGVRRFDVMYNDFVIVGPKADPAGIRGGERAADALARIAAAKAAFTSRADDSGTHKLELELWKAAGVDPKPASGTWYRETGSGMGATLNTANGLGAYALADRGTWISFENKGDLEILVQGDPQLFNQYGVTLVNPAKFPHVKAADGQVFVDWLISPKGQAALAGYKIAGQQLFYPNAKPAAPR